MNRLLEKLKKRKSQRHAGLTLIELLIAMGVSTVVVMVAASFVIQTMESGISAEEPAASGLNGIWLAALWKQKSPPQHGSSRMFLPLRFPGMRD